MCSFFFFKQKTAYEMRISDWSSDVCSSDLIGAVMFPGSEGDALAGRHGLAFAEPVGDRSDAARRARVDDAILIISREMLVADQAIGPEVGDADLEHIGARAHRIGDIDTVRQIGRAHV